MGPEKAMKTIRGMETKLGSLSLEKRRLQEDLTAAFSSQSGTDILAQPDVTGKGV